MRLTTPLTIVALAAMILASSASAATRYAEPGGDGPAASCPQSNPCDLEVAVEHPAAGTGDRIVVLPGTYELGNRSIALDHELDVGGRRSDPRPRVITTATNGSVFNVEGNSTNTRVHDLIAEAQAPAWFGVGGIALIERVQATGPLAGCSPGWTGVIRDSVCVGEGASSRGVLHGYGCGGPQEIPPVSVVNVTAVASGVDSIGVLTSVNGGCDTKIEGRNVIAIGEGSDIAANADGAAGSRAEVALENSIFDSSSAPAANEFASAPGAGTNLTATPLFFDAPGGDYRQLPGSPSIDAGGDDALLGVFDFEGDRRVVGSSVDIGADEFAFACAGRRATIVGSGGPITGTPGNDVIVGTNRGERIRSRGGNDRVCSLGGNDTVRAGSGNDRVNAGRGQHDDIGGGGGRDNLNGGPGRRDRCDGGPGRDRATGCERQKRIP